MNDVLSRNIKSISANPVRAEPRTGEGRMDYREAVCPAAVLDSCGSSRRGFVERGLTQRFGQEAVREVVHGGLRVGYHQLHLGFQRPVQFPAQLTQVGPFRQLEERRQISR